MCGLKGYMKKSGFNSVILGLSGGVDSALSLSIAVDTLGSKNVKCFFLPSIYTSKESKEDAYKIAKNFKVKIENISIESLRNKIKNKLSSVFNAKKDDITSENIQSRLRGLILMSISNKFNSLLITTGNKSELSVGYATLYGDMCGGYSILKDVYKSKVFELCKWRNKSNQDLFKIYNNEIIPNNIIIKEPTAELKFNQKDSDTLPSYETLDAILELLIDNNEDLNSIIKRGFKKELVKKVWSMIKNAEFKRYQSTIGPKISKMSFDNDRRFPITNNFLI